MANVISREGRREITTTSAQRQAYHILHFGFVAAPVIAGLDKFADLLTNWDAYLAPQLQRMLGSSTHGFMMVVGAIEIVAGLVVALRPKFGGYLVAAWLAGIITNLLLQADFYDIALRDFGLLFAALTLARLATAFDRPAGARA